MSMVENRVTVPLDAHLREFVEQVAAREHRTLAGAVRHLIATQAAAAARGRADNQAA